MSDDLEFIYYFSLLIGTNLLFLIPSYIFFRKKYVLISAFYFLITIFSTIYHTCFFETHYPHLSTILISSYCPVKDLSRWGMTIMFLDIFFANCCFLFPFMLTLPILDDSY